MAREWIAPKCEYTIQGNTVRTDGNIREKLTGTYMGQMVGCSPYGTAYTATTRMMGLWGEDISDEPAVITGTMLEERIIDYLAGKHSDVGLFLKAEDLDLAAREGDHANWKSDFDDEVFGGHVDGIVSKDGQDYILEIKTVNRRQIEEKGVWINGVPPHYLWQVYLYNHFITRQDKAYFGLGIVDSRTYDNPNMWVANKENCKLIEISIDQEMVARKIDEIRQIYLDTVGKGVSAECDMANDLDAEVHQHLVDISSDMPMLADLVRQYTELKAANKAYTDKIKDDVAKEKKLNERIKDMMGNWGITECDTVKLSVDTRTDFDFVKADADGFDYSKYLKTRTVNTLRTKSKKVN